MDQLVFQNAEDAVYFNKTFVNLKLNSDNKKNKSLFDKFNIYGLPTTVILNSDGEEIDRIIGFKGREPFVAMIKDYVNGKNTLAALKELEKIQPENVGNLYKIAGKLTDRQAREEAINYYSRVLELDKTNSNGFNDDAEFSIASLTTKVKKDETPLLNYIKNSKSDDFINKAYNQLIRFNKRNGTRERVLALYEEALAKFPEDADQMNSYAWYIFKSKIEGSYEKGIVAAEKAVKLKPESDGIWDTLAQLQFAAGNKEEAIKAMQKAVELGPKTDSYKKLLVKYKES